ncbi:MAG: membrane protein insertion efficiency factor YidD [Alphaproteobacteria bacterium]|nr:membrane protein insertion efficiency factor YidD [Alphaproteobacteria bacterium]OJV45254.1 MAG: membrane protein insertion efficiency factor YidD [Alphaproteobacteria bacterium 43-37]
MILSSKKQASYILALIFLGLIWCYQKLISPYLAPRCRFLPTCSSYAKEALETHGLVKGMQLALQRVCRCHPWGGSGFDPVPKKEELD